MLKFLNKPKDRLLDPNFPVRHLHRHHFVPVLQFRIQTRLPIRIHHLTVLNFILVLTILTEHAHDRVQDDFGLRQIGRCALDEHILRV